ncbi:MAG: nuclease-related domain-containing protein, partial [Leptolyngbyaceae bacterium]|nr:nuclease-related domain-containing protein [Leptolyngbyaceae bacterium]
MIIKELGDFTGTGKFAQAGRNAEETMAFYLKRAFGDDQKVAVFNNLRLEKQDDAAQIDHLVIHRYGMIIIESKSVTTRVEVNEYGEWKRCFNDTCQGIPSPIQQAKRQAEFLKKYLEDHVENLLRKVLGLQTHFGVMPIDWIVAISDDGIINRPKNNPLEEVYKADQVSDQVRTLIEKRRKADSLFNLSLKDTGFSFNEVEFSKITQFL